MLAHACHVLMTSLIKSWVLLDMMAHSCNSSTWEAEAGGWGLKPAGAT
jgi:hypothetical protein